MSSPLVSILITCYNDEDYIEDAVASAINQTYKNIEIIIVDDGSTDSSNKKIRNFIKKDKRIKLIENTVNLGFLRSKNILLDNAKGQYICPLDSDDMYHPSKVELQVEYLEKHKDTAAVFSNVELINNKGAVYKSNSEIDTPLDFWFVEDSKRISLVNRFFHDSNILAHGSAMIRKSCIEDIGNYNERLLQAQDFDLWTRLIQKWDLYVFKEKLFIYRLDRSSNNRLSSITNSNTIRVTHEISEVIYNFIANMDSNLFYDAFKNDIRLNHKLLKDSTYVECAKYLLLLSWKFYGYNNKLPALLYFSNVYNEDFITKLEKHFNYTIKDYYKDNAETLTLYPLNFYEEFETFKEEYSKLINSKSWKVTKPLRLISKGINSIR